MYRKFKIEDSFIRNILSGSIMDYCLADETLEKVNEHVQKVQVHRLVGQKCSVGQNMDNCLADVLSERVCKYEQKVQDQGLFSQKYVQYVKSELLYG